MQEGAPTQDSRLLEAQQQKLTARDQEGSNSGHKYKEERRILKKTRGVLAQPSRSSTKTCFALIASSITSIRALFHASNCVLPALTSFSMRASTRRSSRKARCSKAASSTLALRRVSGVRTRQRLTWSAIGRKIRETRECPHQMGGARRRGGGGGGGDGYN